VYVATETKIQIKKIEKHWLERIQAMRWSLTQIRIYWFGLITPWFKGVWGSLGFRIHKCARANKNKNTHCLKEIVVSTAFGDRKF
jgi:hypothetical protein